MPLLCLIEIYDNLLNEIVNVGTDVGLGHKGCFRVWGLGLSDNSDELCQPFTEFLGKKVLMKGEVPFNVVSMKSAKNVRCHPNYLEASYGFMTLFLVSFVPEQLFVRLHACHRTTPR